MKKNFIRALYESEIQTAELALATESISEELQGMIEKLTNIKIKELATLVKKIKYDGDLQKAESFEQSIGEKLDQIIQSITETKSDIDNEVVKLFNGEELSGGDGAMDGEPADFESDLGDFDEESFDEFGDDESEFSDEDLSLAGFDEITREKK